MGNNCSRDSAVRTKTSLQRLPSLKPIISVESESRSLTPVQPKRKKTINVNSNDVELIVPVQQLPPTPQPRTPSPDEQSAMTTIENAMIIWFTTEPDANQNEIDQMQRRFRSFQLYTNIDEFYAFIFQLNGEKVLLIFSDELGLKMISLIHSRSELVAFYLLDRQQMLNQNWKKSYRKVQGIFTEFHSMFEQISSEILLKKIDQMPVETVSSSSIGYRDALQQMIRNDFDYREEHRKSFIEQAHQRHPDQSMVIDEFEKTYTRQTSIQWLTKKTFVYSMINDAYRSNDVKELLSISFLLQDIQHEIEEHCASVDPDSDPLNVYYGQGMSESEFETLKSNETTSNYLALPNILWSTIDRSSALTKAHRARNHSNYRGTLFSIEIQSSVPHLSLENYVESSAEILFSIDGLFRIKKCQQIEDYVWQIDLIYMTKNHPDLIKEHQLFTGYYQGETNWEKLSAYLIETKQFHRAEIMHNTLIRFNFLHDPKQLASLHEQLAFIYDQMNNIDRSLFHYKKSLKFYLKILPSNDEYLLLIYQQIGILFFHKQQYDHAIAFFKCALAIAIHANQIDYVQVADFYHLIGKSFQEEGDSFGAIVNYQYSLENKLREEPIDYLSVAESYQLIGNIFAEVSDSSTALSYYLKVLTIQNRFLPPNHSLLAMTNYKIAQVHDCLQQYKESVEYICRALNIARHALGSEHEQVKIYEDFLEQLRTKTKINVVPNGAVYG